MDRWLFNVFRVFSWSLCLSAITNHSVERKQFSRFSWGKKQIKFNQALQNILPSYSWLLLVKRLGNQQVSYCVIDVIRNRREKREKRHGDGCKWEDGLFLLNAIFFFVSFAFLRSTLFGLFSTLRWCVSIRISGRRFALSYRCCSRNMFSYFLPTNIYRDVYRFFLMLWYYWDTTRTTMRVVSFLISRYLYTYRTKLVLFLWKKIGSCER